MRLESTDLEEFLRREIDSGIVIRTIQGLELGPSGIIFQYASEQQVIMVVMEYATAGSLILAPVYAPKQEVEELIVRETFQDHELKQLNEVHDAFLVWLQEKVDPEIIPLEAKFYSRTEPVSSSLIRRLHSVAPLASHLAAMGYPEGMLHIYTGLDLNILDEPTATPEVRKNILEGESFVVEELISKKPNNYTNRIVLSLLLVLLASSSVYAWKWMKKSEMVLESRIKIGVSQARIPSGVFIMGCRLEECASNEIPHRVSISKDFFIMESEVTQQQYSALMGENPSENYQCGQKCPVENVPWEKAVEFANRLSKNHQYNECYTNENNQWQWVKDCKGWRLPTEAEWEYAALGYQTGKPNKNQIEEIPVNKTAWYIDLSVLNQVPKIIGESNERQFEMAKLFVQSHEGCRKARNGYGLCDMSGNVWEWVWNWYEEDAAERNHNLTDPVGPALGRTKVLKGGSFASPLRDLYPYKRIHIPPWAVTGETKNVSTKQIVEVSKGTIGFRLVRSTRP